jgi:hypothetical protein
MAKFQPGQSGNPKGRRKLRPEQKGTKHRTSHGNPNWKKGISGNPPTQFPPGVSGNPGGRPKKLPITDRYRERLEQTLPKTKYYDRERKKLCLPDDATYGDLLSARQMFEAANRGRTDAAREIREAVEGKAIQRLRVEGPDGGPVETTVAGLGELKASIAELTNKIRSRAKGNKSER